MAQLTARTKKAFLRNLWEAIPEGTALTLRESLIAASRGFIQLIEGGYLITSVSSSGHNTSFAVAGSQITPDQMADLCEEMIERYDYAEAVLVAQDTPIELGNETAIFNSMMAKLVPVRRFSNDYSLLGRWCYT